MPRCTFLYLKLTRAFEDRFTPGKNQYTLKTKSQAGLYG